MPGGGVPVPPPFPVRLLLAICSCSSQDVIAPLMQTLGRCTAEGFNPWQMHFEATILRTMPKGAPSAQSRSSCVIYRTTPAADLTTFQQTAKSMPGHVVPLHLIDLYREREKQKRSQIHEPILFLTASAVPEASLSRGWQVHPPVWSRGRQTGSPSRQLPHRSQERQACPLIFFGRHLARFVKLAKLPERKAAGTGRVRIVGLKPSPHPGR